MGSTEAVRVDASAHVWTLDTIHFPWAVDATVPPPTQEATPERLFRDLATAGVTAAVAVQPSAYGDDHRYLLESASRAGGRIAPVGLLRVRGPGLAARAEALLDAGCRGLRLIVIGEEDWTAAGWARELWSLAARRRASVGFLASPAELDAIAELAAREPELPVVVDHLGLITADAFSGARASLARLAASRNVAIRVSALGALTDDGAYRPLLPLLHEVRRRFGHERMLYGTDWPFCVEGAPYRSTIDALDLAYDWSEQERNAVLGGNALRLWWEAPEGGSTD